MKRRIIRIDENTCTGCGACIPDCPEGAIRLIDGKARLVGEQLCDGLGACLGHCPEGAITIEEREAEPYDERKVMDNIIRQGPNMIRAHLEHLRSHGQEAELQTALSLLEEKGLQVPAPPAPDAARPRHAQPGLPAGGCPGSRAVSLTAAAGGGGGGGNREQAETGSGASQLAHWPVQLHLVSPAAPAYQGADLLLAADCTAFAAGNFHGEHLKGKALAVACPKLDTGRDVYIEKLQALIDDAGIHTLTVLIMQVPCCGGLLQLARTAAARAARKVPIHCRVLGLQGEIIRDERVDV
jgi:NAD-dependent dihydropyrimidine dehydrogenase PreA subunit